MRNKVPPICDHLSMNGHTQSGIYDLGQTPSGEIISKKEVNEFIKNGEGTDIIKLSSQYFSAGHIT